MRIDPSQISLQGGEVVVSVAYKEERQALSSDAKPRARTSKKSSMGRGRKAPGDLRSGGSNREDGKAPPRAGKETSTDPASSRVDTFQHAASEGLLGAPSARYCIPPPCPPRPVRFNEDGNILPDELGLSPSLDQDEDTGNPSSTPSDFADGEWRRETNVVVHTKGVVHTADGREYDFEVVLEEKAAASVAQHGSSNVVRYSHRAELEGDSSEFDTAYPSGRPVDEKGAQPSESARVAEGVRDTEPPSSLGILSPDVGARSRLSEWLASSEGKSVLEKLSQSEELRSLSKELFEASDEPDSAEAERTHRREQVSVSGTYVTASGELRKVHTVNVAG